LKETGIIMSGNHPRLVIDGIKTQTRRTQGLDKINKGLLHLDWQAKQYYGNVWTFKSSIGFTDIKCPYGQVGDRLWVRETWRVESFLEGEPMLFGYKDGQTMEENEYCDTLGYESWNERVCIQSTEDAKKAFAQGLVRQDEDGMYRWDIGKSPCKWRPSIFMPRWASRITLEITDIRVERVQEITGRDCIAEGIQSDTWSIGIERMIPKSEFQLREQYPHGFKHLWDSLNAKRGYGWDFNPWVWVISFKVFHKEYLTEVRNDRDNQGNLQEVREGI